MAQPFNPSQAVQFDLAKGQVKLGASLPRVLVPADALSDLLRNSSEEAKRAFGRKLGAEAGRRIAERLRDELSAASIEVLVEHLGGELALVGVGSLGVERWGRALVITIDEPPWPADTDWLLAAIVEGALEAAFSRSSHVIETPRAGSQARLLVMGERANETVRRLLAEGNTLGAVVDKLHASERAG
jgi:hypothetical protein